MIYKHFDLDQMLFYGSYASNTETGESDIDVAIVLKDFLDNYFKVVPTIWKLRKEIDLRIEPHAFEAGKDKSGILKEILKNEITI